MGLEEVLTDQYKIYAHIHDGKNPETLEEHIQLCIKYYKKIWEEKRLADIFDCFLEIYLGDTVEASQEIKNLFKEMIDCVITFHDTGKMNPVFQKEKMKYSCPGPRQFLCLSGANHSLLSSVIYMDYFCHKLNKLKLPKEEKKKFRGLIFANGYVISRHHGDLGNMKAFGLECAEGGEIFTIVQEFQDNRPAIFRGWTFFDKKPVENMETSWEKAMEGASYECQIAAYTYVRLMYSLLVACDYYATTEYMAGIETMEFGNLKQKDDFIRTYEGRELTQKIRMYEKDKHADQGDVINILRNELFLEAEKNWREHEADDMFFLEAPTGGGKSNIAVNLSLQMLKKGQDKIYYIYPFNTLVEQNLDSLRTVFGEDEELFSKIAVVNSLTPIKVKKVKVENGEDVEDDGETYYQSALLDRQFLNYPFILATHVHLFQTMFGCQREAIFGFLQMANSVIVLDEIQSYKNTIWSEIIWFLKVFAKILNIKVVIMSATLPDLEYLTGKRDSSVQLIQNRDQYFNHHLFKERVKPSFALLNEKMSMEGLVEHISEQLVQNKNILVEFIKKDSAYDCYHILCEKNLDYELRLLTGDDNQIDREKVLDEIKKEIKLGHGKKFILIVTQVVEAGVDIDMDIGYKNISKLDSEEQFMGRINRSSKRDGIAYFFQMDSARDIYHNDIRVNKEFTLQNEVMQKVLDTKQFDEYYHPVLDVLKKQWNESTGKEGLEQFFGTVVGNGDFGGVNQHMQLIEEDQWHMSVFLARNIDLPDGQVLDGQKCWDIYTSLLKNREMPYARRQVELSEIRSKMSHFIYQIKKNPDLIFSDRVGDLYEIPNGKDYFENEKLNKKKLENAGVIFI